MSKDYIPNEYKNKAEEIMREMYKHGYHDAINDGNINMKEAYNSGLNAAWECARKIAELNKSEQNTLFGVNNPYPSKQTLEIFKNFSAAKAIEKVKEYESRVPDKDVGEIKVGDEVMYGTRKGVVSKVYSIENGAMNTLEIWLGSSVLVIKANNNNLILTGKHYPEIAEVLRKMKNESD